MKGTETRRRPRLLAIASGGGHWAQLCLLRPAFEGYDVHYATTIAGLADQFGAGPAHLIPDCNRDRRLSSTLAALRIGALILRLRPRVVVTTGALPGLIAVAIARRLGARTVWIDSIANAEEMSMAGKHARKHVDLWLSQWPHVAQISGAGFEGALL